MDVIADKLAAMPLFAGLGAGEVEKLSKICERVYLAPGKTLINAGETADAAYLTLDNHIMTETQHDGERVNVTVPEGAAVLELAMIVDIQATARFHAEGHARIIKIPRDRLLRRLEEDPALADALNDALVHRLNEMSSAMQEAAATFDASHQSLKSA